MNGVVLFLNDDHVRERAAMWVRNAPRGTRVEFRQVKRSLSANSKLWAALSDISRQVDWYGTKLSTDDWKTIFTASLRKARVVPGIDAGTVVPLGLSTSTMTKAEFSDLLELIGCFGAERGVVFGDEVVP